MKTLTAFALALVMAPINALVSTFVLSQLWEWFVLRDYGDGPSRAAWFGLSTIFGVVMLPMLINMPDKPEDPNTNPLLKVLFRGIAVWTGLLLLLGFSWVVGFALHWT